MTPQQAAASEQLLEQFKESFKFRYTDIQARKSEFLRLYAAFLKKLQHPFDEDVQSELSRVWASTYTARWCPAWGTADETATLTAKKGVFDSALISCLIEADNSEEAFARNIVEYYWSSLCFDHLTDQLEQASEWIVDDPQNDVTDKIRQDARTAQLWAAYLGEATLNYIAIAEAAQDLPCLQQALTENPVSWNFASFQGLHLALSFGKDNFEGFLSATYRMSNAGQLTGSEQDIGGSFLYDLIQRPDQFHPFLVQGLNEHIALCQAASESNTRQYPDVKFCSFLRRMLHLVCLQDNKQFAPFVRQVLAHTTAHHPEFDPEVFMENLEYLTKTKSSKLMTFQVDALCRSLISRLKNHDQALLHNWVADWKAIRASYVHTDNARDLSLDEPIRPAPSIKSSSPRL